ncbi:MAG: glycoside hydrolase domain-containing protein [Planctomycetota bacterium]
MRTLSVVCWVVLTGAALGGEGRSTAGTEVLRGDGFWRCHLTWKTEQARTEDGKIEMVHALTGRRHPGAARDLSTPPPPAGWTAADFDDSGWIRMTEPGAGWGGSRELALLCMRGKFEVRNPAGVREMTLDLGYRGGAAVYLNGKEVARGHLPEGSLTADSLAEDYPEKAYLNAKGKVLRNGFGDPRAHPDRFKLRVRRLDGVRIPGKLLRKGVNVLAVELHRAPTGYYMFSKKHAVPDARYAAWSMLGLVDLRLSAPSGSPLVANVSRPAGVQVWNQSIAERVWVTDYGTPGEKPTAVVISGCRNGAFSGQVVVGSDKPLAGLKAEAGALAAVEGGGTIPAAAIQIRYALPDDSKRKRDPKTRRQYYLNWFSGLEETAPAEVSVTQIGGGAVQPVWITVNVPRDAKPGDYAGKVTVSARGLKTTEIPVKLHVADWTLPNSKDFSSHVGLIQSPDSVAAQYKVEMWSEEHWKLLDRSFKFMAQVGADDVYLPLICRTHFGNEHGMVRWRRNGKGWKHDFSIAERYVDTAVRHLGRVPVVCLYAWETHTGSLRYHGRGGTGITKGVPFTKVDTGNGKLTETEGPKWGTPESREFWKPVLAGMREILRKRGLEKSMMVGLAGDARPVKECVQDFKTIAPDVKWVVHTHPGCTNLYGIQTVGYRAHVWAAKALGYRHIFEPAHGWSVPDLFTCFPRPGPGGICGIHNDSPPGCFHVLVESMVASGHRGFGRAGVDFWPVMKDKRGRGSNLLHRYIIPGMSVSVNDAFDVILKPGREGPISSMRFELMRQGVQETEARIYIERALADPARKSRLGSDLAGRYRKLADQRVWRIMRQNIVFRRPTGAHLYAAGPWQEQAAELYAIAAEVAAKLGEK